MATESGTNEINAADLPDEATDVEASGRKKGSSKRIILLAALLAVTVGGAAGGFYMSGGADMLSSGEENTQADRAVTEKAEGVTAPSQMTYKLPEVVVNIVGTAPSGRRLSRYLKVGVSLIHPEGAAERIERREDFLRDSFQDFLRQVDEAELEGTAGLVRLRTELLRRTHAILGEGAVSDVLITELLVQ